MITNAEIHIFRGDPTKGHNGWMWAVCVDNKRWDGECTLHRAIAALEAAEFIDELERVRET